MAHATTRPKTLPFRRQSLNYKYGKAFSLVGFLAKDQKAVRRNVHPRADITLFVHLIIGLHLAIRITDVAKISAVNPGVGVETDDPFAAPRESESVVVHFPVMKGCNHKNVILWPALHPAVKRDNLVAVIDVKDFDAGTGEPLRGAREITAKVNQVSVQPIDAFECFHLRPIEGRVVAKRTILEKFLTLEKHGDAGHSQSQACGQRRTFARVVAGAITGFYGLGSRTLPLATSS